ncbi:NHL repeat-containing protein [Nocardiopsis halotolerans]|uniref:PQQ-binding-like beta-propeller repeat protein n=1 Tax=Nocardiopsis halotolerans TaxID=124252 RepID=UPI000344C5E3|nr:PQQ-binding-like beta-propeller repeat protein [Nocardiopsis halotolerans]
MRREHRALGATLSTLVLLTGCGTAAGTAQDPPPEEETPHGYVEGAQESAEPQSRLVIADTGTGEVRVLDLITEEMTELDPVEGVDGITGDGRFAYLRSSDHGTTHVVDSGSWTVDHGDHQHYYRAPIRSVGTLDALAADRATTDTALTALTSPDGGTTVLDRAALEEGAVETAVPVPGNAEVALPFAGHLLVAEGGPEGAVSVYDRDGTALEPLGDTCAEPRGQAVTRRGAVIGCADGTLHVTEEDGALTSRVIAHPGGSDGRTGEFGRRPGSATLATVSTGGDVWVLDLAEPAWNPLDLTGAVTVAAVGAGGPVLALTGDGTLHSLDPETGEELATADLLDGTDTAHTPAIRVDTSRTYLNDAENGVVYEIDHNDDLRVARTLTTGIAPHLMVETGR